MYAIGVDYVFGHYVVAIKLIPTGSDKEPQPVTESSQQTHTIDFHKEEEFSQLQSEMILAAKSVRIRFLNTSAQVNKILQECDHQVFLEACSKLYAYASDSKVERLLPSNYISNITTIEEMLKRLSFLWSWHNCSVLRTLLKACDCHDGLTLLNDFEAQIDEDQPIELFPIPRLSSKMAPSSSSAYTILSVRSEHYQKSTGSTSVHQRSSYNINGDIWHLSTCPAAVSSPAYSFNDVLDGSKEYCISHQQADTKMCECFEVCWVCRNSCISKCYSVS